VADLFWLLLILGAVAVVSWVSYRAGSDTVRREAEYTIATLRRSNRVLRFELESERERATGLGRELIRLRTSQIDIPEWMKEGGA